MRHKWPKFMFWYCMVHAYATRQDRRKEEKVELFLLYFVLFISCIYIHALIAITVMVVFYVNGTKFCCDFRIFLQYVRNLHVIYYYKYVEFCNNLILVCCCLTLVTVKIFYLFYTILLLYKYIYMQLFSSTGQKAIYTYI